MAGIWPVSFVVSNTVGSSCDTCYTHLLLFQWAEINKKEKRRDSIQVYRRHSYKRKKLFNCWTSSYSLLLFQCFAHRMLPPPHSHLDRVTNHLTIYTNQIVSGVLWNDIGEFARYGLDVRTSLSLLFAVHSPYQANGWKLVRIWRCVYRVVSFMIFVPGIGYLICLSKYTHRIVWENKGWKWTDWNRFI